MQNGDSEQCLGFSKLSKILFSDVIAERMKHASDYSEPIKSEYIRISDSLGNGVMMIMSNKESERVYQVCRYIHLRALFVQREVTSKLEKT